MENLESRFDAVQEKLLDIYERSPNTLDDQITYWDLIRWEQVLLNYARRSGKRTLGLQPVPSLQASENNAKEAIAMHMYLTQLKQSGFAEEPWTLTDSSSMNFMAVPKYTFKKHPKAVTIVFDDDKNNAVRHTLWQAVYYQDTNDKWHKTESDVDVQGIFYTVDGVKNYYVLFGDDAKMYSRTGQWDVTYNNKTYSSSVASSTGPAAREPTELATNRSSSSSEKDTSETRPDSSNKPEKRSWSPASVVRSVYSATLRARSRSQNSEKASSRSSSDTSEERRHWRRRRHRSRSRRSRSRVRPRTTSRSRTRSRGRPAGRGRGRGRPRLRSRSIQSRAGSRLSDITATASLSPVSRPSQTRGPKPRCTAQNASRRSRSRSVVARAPTTYSRTPPTPILSPWGGERPRASCQSHSRAHRKRSTGAERRAVQRVSTSTRSRSRSTERLHSTSQKDPAVILLRGRVNPLKCWRWRLQNSKRRVKFQCLSTTFSWVCVQRGDRHSQARMLVTFESYEDRDIFLKTVKFPPGVSYCLGQLDCL